MFIGNAIKLFMCAAAALSAVAGAVSTEDRRPKTPTYLNPKASIDARVEDLLGRMNLVEKQNQLLQGNIANSIDTNYNLNTSSLHQYGTMFAAYMDRDALARLINETQTWMVESNRLYIPTIMQSEGIHGWVDVNATMFPSPLAMACSFDIELLKKVGDVVGSEAESLGIHNIFAPVLDLAREPRWGRIEENYGEDPYLTGELGKAYVEGVQGRARPGTSRTAKHRIAAMVKHFAGFGSPMGGLNIAPVSGGERDMRTIYLPPFKRAIIDGGALSIMNAYHAYDGIPSAIDKHLMTEILRDEWGFKGFVQSDSGAIANLCDTHFVCDGSFIDPQAAILAVTAGTDSEMGGRPMHYATLAEQVKKANIDESILDEAVRRILRVKFLLGLFEVPFGSANYNSTIYTENNLKVSQKIEEESMVLLENDGTLPLDAGSLRSIAVIGPQAAVMQYGDYTPHGVFERGVTPLEGIKALVGDKVNVNYAQGCELWSLDKSGFDDAVKAAENSDIAIVMVGSWTRDQTELWTGLNATTGEHVDVNDLGLFGVQLDLIKAVQASGKPTVVVLITGKPTAEPWLKDNVNAIINAFYPGQYSGQALARIIFGEVNPSGKLSISFPTTVGSLPAYYNYPKSGRPINAGMIYNNGTIDFGYQYVVGTPAALWYFGHGKSYTTFEYQKMELSKAKVTAKEKEITVSVTVKNTGHREGKEVVQIYVDDVIASVVVPNKALKGFKKVSIPVGKTTVVEIPIRLEELQVWSYNNKFELEAGDFIVYAGGSYAELALNSTFTVVKP
ncbi:beta-glucosidase-related glycosidase [Dichotomocladium elegans]|nr:beta-glucosidase-related glycosidase [Dichotomocladium elegans]